MAMGKNYNFTNSGSGSSSTSSTDFNMNNGISLLSNPIRVSTPYIKVQIGDYIFGVYSEGQKIVNNKNVKTFTYPNYIQSLNIKKYNGQVNQYSLELRYPITQNSDPNYFEKVFSSVSETRKIIFSYGDMSAPTFLYKNEEAIITNVSSSFDFKGSSIWYTVTATSTCKLATSCSHNFCTTEFVGKHKPSDIIKLLLRRNSKYGLLDIFTGMKNLQQVESEGWLNTNDKIVNLQAKTNINVLDYISYLVSSMKSSSGGLYRMTIIDDTTGDYDGPYFKIVNATAASDTLDTYEVDIGYPSEVLVKSFTVNQNENYSILYNFSKKLNTDEYVSRIDDNGDIKQIYSPIISSNNSEQLSTAATSNWWKNVTEYPIKATMVIKGVLRPTILMSKVRLNILFYGKKHIYSGLYLITSQEDNISESGCQTTLGLTRVGGDKDFSYTSTVNTTSLQSNKTATSKNVSFAIMD